MNWICCACGTQFAATEKPRDTCPICEDERQPLGEQRWTTLADLARDHDGEFRDLAEGIVGIGCDPGFAIGQRALLVRTDEGNLLWDCISLLDDELVERVNGLGGIRAIAISHPHFYSSMVEWARAFDAPVLLHEADREWVMRPDAKLEFWSGEERELFGTLTLRRLGGHFAGGTVAHWRDGDALFVGDIVMVVPDPGWVSFMWSYPNLIPLPAREVRRIAGALEPVEFDAIYGAWWDRVISQGGKDAVRRSAERYARAVER